MIVMLMRAENVTDASWSEAMLPLTEKGYEVLQYFSQSAHPRHMRWHYVPVSDGEEGGVCSLVRETLYKTRIVDAICPWMAAEAPNPT